MFSSDFICQTRIWNMWCGTSGPVHYEPSHGCYTFHVYACISPLLVHQLHVPFTLAHPSRCLACTLAGLDAPYALIASLSMQVQIQFFYNWIFFYLSTYFFMFTFLTLKKKIKTIFLISRYYFKKSHFTPKALFLPWFTSESTFRTLFQVLSLNTIPNPNVTYMNTKIII